MNRGIGIFMLLLTTHPLTAEEGVLVGAIRWDAWTGGPITEQVEKTLSPRRYHGRLPWFANVTANGTASIDGSPQAVMDKEIGFATSAGLNYWAFLMYQRSNRMSFALKQYLASKQRGALRFCVILHNNLKASDEHWPQERERLVRLLKHPSYQTVIDGRPLVFALGEKGFRFDRVKEVAEAAGRVNQQPYFVYMGWNPPADYAAAGKQGFHAVSAYAYGSKHPAFSDLANAVEQGYWKRAADNGVAVIPLVTTGWDKRPRVDTPVSWEVGQAYHKQKVFPSEAKPQELAGHLRNAITFIRKHPTVCASKAVIVYAWNEYDEGGWLAPTRNPNGQPNTSRLAAFRTVLRPGKHQP